MYVPSGEFRSAVMMVEEVSAGPVALIFGVAGVNRGGEPDSGFGSIAAPNLGEIPRDTIEAGVSAGACVSVVMVSFHTGAALSRSIASVLGDPDVSQLILVNNGNPSEVGDWLSAVAAEDSRLVVVEGQGNIGFSKGCNLGVASATGEYLLLLNPDCLLPARALRKLLDAGRELPEPWVLGPRLVFPDGREQAGARRREPTPLRILIEGLSLYRLFPRLQRINMHCDPLPAAIMAVEVISGACMLVSRAGFLKVGGMDEGYFLHVEDIDFCVRFRQSGGQTYFLPDLEVVHEKGSSGASLFRIEWYKTRGFFRYLRRFRDRYRQPTLGMLVRFALLLRFVLLALRSMVPMGFGRKR